MIKKILLTISIPTLLLAVPSNPSNLQLEATSGTSVSLAWQDNSADETGFKIYRNDKFIAIVETDSTSFVDARLKPNTTYKYTVKATDDTLYVDSANGDDNFSGSASMPFKTIQTAVDHAKAGERVFVKAGLYHEKIVIKSSGTENAPIVIEGERDASGKRLVTVHGGDLVNPIWTDTGNGVYQTRDIPYASYAMTVKQNGVFKDIPRLDISDWKNSEYKSLEKLAYPSNKIVTTDWTKQQVNYWDGIEALYAYKNGTTYIRFRDGSNPNEMKLYSSKGVVNKYGNRDIQNQPMNEGSTFKIENKSYITIKGFNIDGAQNGVLIYGAKAAHNMIEDNEITNGQRRVFIAKNAHHNYIKNNKMHMRLLSNYRPGAYFIDTHSSSQVSKFKALPEDERYRYVVAEHYYNAYKHEIGFNTFSALDDCGIFVDGAGGENEIYGNEIYDTLGGVLGSQIGKIYIHDNLMHHISSVATGVVDKNIYENYIYKNRMYNVNLGLRIQLNMNKEELKYLAKKAWFFENIVYNPSLVGSNIFFFRGENPVKPTNASQLPHIYIYHNTFVGADIDNNSVEDVDKNIVIVNNIFSDMNMRLGGKKDATVAYNWFNSQSNYQSDNNIVKIGQKIWNVPARPTSMSNFKLPENSDARESGIDLSKAFSIGGKNFKALPFMKNGYFKGARPNMGAIQ